MIGGVGIIINASLGAIYVLEEVMVTLGLLDGDEVSLATAWEAIDRNEAALDPAGRR